MALFKDLIPLPIDLGLNTKVDDKQEPIGKLTVAENIVYETIRSLRKRNGYDSVSLEILGGTSIAVTKILTKFKNELVAFNSSTLFSFADSVDKWIDQGTVSSVFPTSKTIFRSSSAQSELDCEFIENLKISVWKDSVDGIRYSVVDNDTGSFLVSDGAVDSAGVSPRVANIQGFVYIVYGDTTNLRYRRFNVLDPETLEAEKLIASNFDSAAPTVDIVSSGNTIFVAFNSTSGSGKLAILSISSDETVSGVTNLSGEDPSNCVDIIADRNSRLVITYSDGTDVKYVIFPFTLLAPVLAATVIEAVANVVNATTFDVDGTNYDTFYEISAASSVNHFVRKNDIDVVGAVGTPAVHLRGVGLASKVFVQNSNQYLTVIHESTLQSTYFVIDDTATVVSKISPNTGGELIAHGQLPHVKAIDSDNIILTSQVKGRNVSEDNTFFSLLGVNSTVLSFAPQETKETRINQTQTKKGRQSVI